MEKTPPGIETVSGIGCVAIGAVAGAGEAPSLAASSSPCAGTATGELAFGFSTGWGTGAGVGVFAVTAGGAALSAGVGA
jgi:hypothetical protein